MMLRLCDAITSEASEADEIVLDAVARAQEGAWIQFLLQLSRAAGAPHPDVVALASLYLLHLIFSKEPATSAWSHLAASARERLHHLPWLAPEVRAALPGI
jgi:hypothetical protein